jgi:ubiquinone/menaquinone biosynthesis C-methylase UbiE
MQPVSRVSNTREQVRANYDRLSHVYDWFTMGPERKLQQEGLARLQVHAGESVLEIGFGTGRGLVILAHSVGSTGSVYGIDLSAGMLQVAASRLAGAGLADRVELKQADAVELPYLDSSLDAVFMSFTLELFDTPEISMVLKECRRVLCPGGRICLVALSNTRPGLALAIYEWAHRTFPLLVDCRPIFATEALQQAEFAEVQTVQRSLWGLAVESVCALNPPGPAV